MGSNDDPAALSFAQQRIWFVEQMQPDRGVNNLTFAHRMHGPLDPESLRRALEEVIRRHDSLRTLFPSPLGTPRPEIREPGPWLLPVEDLSGLDRAAIDAEVERRWEAQVGPPFDLGSGPLLRTTLLRAAADEHVLVVTVHHMVFDGWSVGVFWREVMALYTSFAGGSRASLPPVPLQYADYAAWQQRCLSGEQLDRQLGYWKQRLAGAPEQVSLPRNGPRPTTRSQRGSRLSIELERDVVRSLRELARRNGASLFMALLAGFRAVVARASGQDDLCIGIPTADRERGELDGVIGPIVNTVVVRSAVAGDASFSQLLARERDVVLEAYANQDAPFEMVVDALGVDRNSSRNPLFQLWFAQDTTREQELSCGIRSVRLTRSRTAARFDLSVVATEADDRVRLSFVYSEDLLEPAVVERIARSVDRLVSSAVIDPDRPLAEIALGDPPAGIDPGSPVEHRVYPPIHRAVERLVAADPAAVIVRQGDREWTRGQLWEAAVDVARSLAASGVNPGDRVALRGPPSFGLIAGMLGVLRSGACLVPMSSRLSPENARWMLIQAAVRRVLSVADDEPDGERDGIRINRLDRDSGRVVADPTDPAHSLPGEPSPRSPAYVYFTSGTTGPQKGVLGTHEGLSHFLAWQGSTFDDIAGPICAQLTHIGFDVFLRDVLFPVTTGKVLALPPREMADLSVDELLRWIQRAGVTAIHTVPSLARSWLNECPDDVTLPALRCVFIAGEPLPAALIDGWRQRFRADTEFINLYGPTETTLAKCWYQVGPRPHPGIQPIGRPLPQTEVLILRDGDHLCSAGEPGEIVIRTPFRTLGYLDSVSAENRRFRRNPFRDDDGDILYRTGDRGAYRDDGLIQILGRIDDQVKIRGQRVDPSGIASLLLSHSSVGEAAVVTVADDAGDHRLAAYVVPSRQGGASAADLTEHLRERLPSYMVPASITLLDHLPKTVNGKLDRRALPAPEWTAAASYTPPRTPDEEKLLAIWTRLLRAERIGVDDDFFALGGHSLLLLRLVREIEHAFGVQIPVVDVFTDLTIARIAARISQARGTEAPAAAPTRSASAVRSGEVVEAPSLPVQAWMVNLHDDPELALYMAHAWRLDGELDRSALERSLREIVARHEILRTTYRIAGREVVQVVHPAADSIPVVEQADVSDRPQTERESAAVQWLRARLWQPIDLASGPVCRFGLARVDSHTHVLGAVVHHANFDGYSSGLFATELRRLYAGCCEGRDVAAILPPLPLQYRQLTEILVDRGRRQQAYWEKRLAGAVPVQLPSDFPRQLVEDSRPVDRQLLLPSDRLSVQFPAELMSRVDQVGERLGATRYVLLLAGFIRMIQESSGQRDISVWNSFVLRQEPGADQVMGLLPNPLIIRVDASGDLSARAIIARTRDAALEAAGNADAPVVDIIDPRLPRILFNFQPWERTSSSDLGPGLGMRAVSLGRPPGTFKTAFELGVWVTSDASGSVYLSCVYPPDLFRRHTVAGFIDRYRSVLERFVTSC